MEIIFKILVVTLAIVAAGLLSFKIDWKGSNTQFRPGGLFLGIVLFVLAIGFISSVGQINAGQRGVVLNFGAVTDRTLDEGLYFLTPFVNSVETMDVQTYKHEVPVAAASKDLQDVQTTVALNYHVNPERVNHVYQTLRRDYVARVIDPAIQESAKAVTAQFDAGQLITARAVVRTAMEDSLRDRLARSGMVLESMSITNFAFSEAFTEAIEAKQVALQRSQEAENRLLQIRVEATQAKARADGEKEAAIAAAEGQKQAAILAGQGQAQAIASVAEAQAKANNLLNQTITEEVIRFNLVQKMADDVQVIVLPAGQDFILGESVLGARK